MATERLPMRHTREILRQKWVLGCTHRAVAQSLGISHGAVGAVVVRARGRSEERRVGKECRLLCRSRWSPYH